MSEHTIDSENSGKPVPGAVPKHTRKAAKKAKAAKKSSQTKKAAREIMAATGWQAHTIRGFVSLLGSKGGETVESSKSAAGERSYKIAK